MAIAFARKKSADLVRAAGFRNTLDRITQHARSGSGGLVLASAPGVGCSTLLKNFFESSFHPGALTIPIYLSVDVNVSGESVVDHARLLALRFLTQVIAFRRQEFGLTTSSIGPEEIARLAVSEDIFWIDRAVERLNDRVSDHRVEMIARYFSVVGLAESAGIRPFMIFDDVHRTQIFENGSLLFEGLRNLCLRSSLSSVIAGRRKFVASFDEFDRIDLDRPTHAEAARFIAEEAARNSTMIDEASCDLLAVQFASRPGFMKSIVKRLRSYDDNIAGFPAIQRAYVDELFTGSIGNWFQREIDSAVSNHHQRRFVEFLTKTNRSPSVLQPLEALKRLSNLDDATFERAIAVLNTAEILRVTSNHIEGSSRDLALTDYLESRHRLENLGDPRSIVVSQTLGQCISRSSTIMASQYRASTAIGLRELLQKFDTRSVPLALFDPNVFNSRYKGKAEVEIDDELKIDNDVFALPFIVFTASTESAYPPIGTLIAAERSAFGSGSRDRNCGSDGEIYWIAAEIETKLPANSEQAEFWCDRLEAAAIASDFRNYQIWLIAPDGFDDEASEVLADRGALGSSQHQAELLKKLLTKSEIAGHTLSSEYEIDIPMGKESELIAAHTLEEIAKRHGINSHEINQIKTALVEACINASEHSHSPDGRIHQKFEVGQDRITMTISNRGVRLADAKLSGDDSKRRGWGLKLIEKLMDEVQISQTDDGTCLSMTKRFTKA